MRQSEQSSSGGGAGPALVWFTRDLRLNDQPALQAAVESGRPVLCCYVLDEHEGGTWALAGAQRWWLHHSLSALDAALGQAGVKLVLRRGDGATEIARLAESAGASAVHVGQPIEPASRASLDRLEPMLATKGCALHRHWTTLLFDPARLRTQTGGTYGVFTPFSKACLALGVQGEPWTAPAHMTAAPMPASDRLEDWALLPVRPNWAAEFGTVWTPGEAAARARLDAFSEQSVEHYADTRNLPGVEGVSRLSAHLHWGEIAPQAVWRTAGVQQGKGARSYISELLWREFSAHLLWHHPTLPDEPLKPAFAAMPWRNDPTELEAWKRGRTGIPIVDAGMRQLWRIGWQHNRVRLITASFLIKHLLIDWRLGEAWFWDCLVDADLGSNSQNWQWVAGSGADASPYFRIFNPWLQGQKFDPDGQYVKHWVPELARLDAKFIHSPWEAPAEVLAACGVVLGQTYPRPIIDLMEGRDRALEVFKQLSGKPADIDQPRRKQLAG